MTVIGEVDEKGFVVEWTIRDFYSLPTQVDKTFCSPPFSFVGEQWRLVMCPNGQEKYKSEEYVGLKLCRVSPGLPVDLSYFLGVKTANNEIYGEEYYVWNFKDRFHRYGSHKFLERSILSEKKSELVPSDNLTCVCRMKQGESTDAASDTAAAKCCHCKETVDVQSLASHEKKCLSKPIKCPECSDVVALKDWYSHECGSDRAKGEKSESEPGINNKVLDDLKRLFLTQDNCDVVLRVKKQEFQAHKTILSARSSVFASRLKEKDTVVIDIEDLDPCSFSDFLSFLYCGNADVLSVENVCSLFTAAEKYNVSDLRTKCLEFTKEKLLKNTLSNISVPRCTETEPIQLAAA